MPKSGIFKLILITSFLLLAAFVVQYFTERAKTKQLIQESEAALELARVSSELEALWRTGDPAMMAPYCRDLFDPTINYSPHYFRCNPDYMKCLLKNRPKFGNIAVEWHRILPAKGTQEWALALKLNHTKLSKLLVLQDSCSTVALPKRRYSYGSGKGEIRWDNFERDIEIDRSPVLWRDVLEWVQAQKINLANKDQLKIETNARHQPATGLILEEMREYCRYRGKALASLPVFEAASYHPRDHKNIRPKRIVKSPYPWTIYRKSEFLYRARQKRWKVNREDCRKAYVAECRGEFPRTKFDDFIPTWIGLIDTIGGVAEVFDNPFNPSANLFVSNENLPAASSWHELGRYASWNGVGFAANDFSNISDLATFNFPFKVGFRCMVEK